MILLKEFVTAQDRDEPAQFKGPPNQQLLPHPTKIS
jgi:hypothetical protein